LRQLNYQDFLRLLEEHRAICITEEDVALAKKHNNNEGERFLQSVVDKYPNISEKPTGGYILPSDFLPGRFRTRVIASAIGHIQWGRTVGMVGEALDNACSHGNNINPDKKVYLLWHRCSKGVEIYVVDEGEADCDMDQKIADRSKPLFGIKEEVSGLDIICSRSQELEYFNLTNPEKKGILLRLALEKNNSEEECNYFGHELLK
jgi:anti-sigma regulatory factor (Ser/Thr protein kinase)